MKRPEHNHHDESCAICALDSMGLRVTKQRKVLYEALLDEESPISAEKIYYELKGREVDINLSTDYRSLEQFVEKGLAVKTSLLDETKALFGINTHEHQHHLICTKCKEIVIITDCPIETYGLEVEKDYGYRISGHKLEIYGLCPKCQD
ncbi:MAG: transcriptional repressor [Firmicutes bacterium HGW-Firmicutes-2]|jgi:Fur family ferric uptake transcriptional regulator|nr:MAG: transcriptional repressor [Firmicutes bacterium HGW-Firmicutes-2]